MANYGQFFGDLGGAVGDLFAAKGASLSAKAFAEGATLAGQNASIEESVGSVKSLMQQRAAIRGEESIRADQGGAGFTAGGSGGDLFHQAVANNSLAIGMTNAQTHITVNSDLAEQAQLNSEAAAAKSRSGGDIFGSALSGIAGVASLVFG